jgi:hypothetical protein
VLQRWRQLPLEQARSHVPRVRRLVQSLADQVAQVTGVRACAVPDAGPASLMDQLTVMVYDASAAAVTPTLVDDLASLRRELS